MSFLKAYLPGPVVDILIPGVVVLILLYLIVPRVADKLNVSGLWDRLMERFGGEKLRLMQFEREIAALKKNGNLLAAAQLYEEAEWYPEALSTYIEAQEFIPAGTLYEKLEEYDSAADMYVRGEDWKRAANLYGAHGRPEKAADLFAQHGQKIDAAKLYFDAKQYQKAGELYEAVDHYPQAAQAFEKLGAFLRAAENYEKHWAATSTIGGSGLLASPSDREARIARLAGQLYEKGGAPERAAIIYQRAGITLEAAQLAAKLGKFHEAGEMLLSEEKLAAAADMFERAGQTERAALLRGEVAFRENDSKRAASEFFKGRDYLRAAEIFETIGDLASAASCFEKSESPIQAANVYLRAGKKKEAAVMFEQGHDYETAAKLFLEAGGEEMKAAELFEKAGRYFDAGKCAHARGDAEHAIRLLQRVEPGEENYDAATLILSRLFIEKNMAGLAADKLKRIIGNRGVSGQTLEHHYALALAYEKLGKREDAIDTYKKILAERYGYEDVEARLTRLARPEAPKPAAAPTGPPTVAVATVPAPSRDAASATAVATAPPYRFLEPIGEGSLGKVFRGTDSRTGATVAIKVFKKELLSDRAVLQRFLTEAKEAHALEHPNLVRLLALTELNGEKAVVMEYVSGPSLAAILARVKRLNVKQALDLLTTLSTALGFAHQKNVFHRGLKMSSVLIPTGGKLRLSGLGLGSLRALAKGTDDALYQPRVAGSDACADLYALGALICHGLTGVPPGRSEAMAALRGLPAIPTALVDLLARALADDPGTRFQSAAELLAAVRVIA